MSQVFQLEGGQKILISDKHFAEGGEALLYHVESPSEYKNHVAKVYKEGKRTNEKLQKLLYLKKNCPQPFKTENPTSAVVWVKEIIYRSKTFYGFLMRYADGIRLEDICNIKLNPKIGTEWKRFELGQSEAQNLRIKLCHNIAAAVGQLHNENHGAFALMDLKPDNIIVLPNGHVSIIDIDSVQILRDGKVIFHSNARTPEYTPPEAYKKEVSPNRSNWDCFSMAIIFYRLLLGIHPYTGTCKAPFANINENSQLIEHGLFPMGRNKHQFEVIPVPHQKFLMLDGRIKNQFIRCFDQSHDDPSLRPSAREWLQTFVDILGAGYFKSKLKEFQSRWLLPSSPFPIHPLVRRKFNLPPQITYSSLFRSSLNRWLGASEKESLAEQLSRLFEKIVLDNLKYDDLISEHEGLIKWFKEKHGEVVAKYQHALKDITDAIENSEANVSKQLLKDNEAKQHDLANAIQALKLKKVQVEEMLAKGSAMLSKFETRKEELYQEYLFKINNTEQDKASKIEELKKSLNAEREKVLAPLRQATKALHAQWQNLLSDISTSEKNEIGVEIERKDLELSEFREKRFSILKTHSIRQNAHLIFNDIYSTPSEIAAELEKHGFYSAADIVNVLESGSIVNTKGTLIKVNGVGKSRGKELKEWANRVNTIVSNSLKNSEEQIENRHLRTRKQIQEKAKLEVGKANEAYKSQKAEIVNNHPGLFSALDKLKEKESIEIHSITAKAEEDKKHNTKVLEALANKSISEIFPKSVEISKQVSKLKVQNQELELQIEHSISSIQTAKPNAYNEKLDFIFDHFCDQILESKVKAESEIETLRSKAINDHHQIKTSYDEVVERLSTQLKEYDELLERFRSI